MIVGLFLQEPRHGRGGGKQARRETENGRVIGVVFVQPVHEQRRSADHADEAPRKSAIISSRPRRVGRISLPWIVLYASWLTPIAAKNSA